MLVVARVVEFHVELAGWHDWGDLDHHHSHVLPPGLFIMSIDLLEKSMHNVGTASMTVVRADGDIVFVGWLAWPGPFVTRDSQAALREMREMRCKCHKDAR